MSDNPGPEPQTTKQTGDRTIAPNPAPGETKKAGERSLVEPPTPPGTKTDRSL